MRNLIPSLLLFLALPGLFAETPRFTWVPDGTEPPPDAGYINVRDAGAKGDGITDDTAVLKAILEAGKPNPHPVHGEARHIYFPDGVYLISEPLLIGDKKKMIFGQSRERTILRLADNARAFQDPARPHPMLSAVNSYRGWQFAQNFFQCVHNLTIDVGSGNPGAVGLEYHTNNGGTVYNVLFRSSDPDRRGAIGLHLSGQPGPGLIYGVQVDGFDVGMLLGGGLHSMVFSRILLTHQRVVGFRNAGNTASIEGFWSENRVPAFEHTGGYSAITGGHFTGGDPGQPALKLRGGQVFLRNIHTAGYARAVEGSQPVEGPDVTQYVQPRVHTLSPGVPELSMDLPVLHPPIPEQPRQASGWHVVRAENNDLTAPLQRAIDAGHEYIWIGSGGEIRDTVVVRNRARVIRGAPAVFRTSGFRAHNDSRDFGGNPVRALPATNTLPPKATFRIEDGESPVVMLAMLTDNYGDGNWDIDHASTRGVIVLGGASAYRNTVSGGRAWFLDNGPGHGTVVTGPNQWVWSWHANPESYGWQPNIRNDSGVLWMLGVKTEKDRTIITTTGGGFTELVGGLFFKNRQRIGMVPAMINIDSHVSCSFAVTRLPYDVLVQEIRGGGLSPGLREQETLPPLRPAPPQAPGQIRELTRQATGGMFVPLYNGYDPARVEGLRQFFHQHIAE